MKLIFPRICYVRYQGNPSIHINVIFLYLFNNRIMFVENNSFSLSLHVKLSQSLNKTRDKR